VDDGVVAAVMRAQLMNLGVTVVTTGDTVVRTGGLDLLILDFAEFQTGFFEAGLQKAASPAATKIVGFVGGHVNEVFFADAGFDDEAKILGNGITICLANDLAGILDRELDLAILVPVGADLELSLTDPFGVIFVDILDLQVVFDVELFQSCQD